MPNDDRPNTLAISPLDGRYQSKVSGLSRIASEGGLILFRLLTEVLWLKHLGESLLVPFELSQPAKKTLNTLQRKLQPLDWQKCETDYLVWINAVKSIEKVTNHDVKAVEYFLRDTLKEAGANSKDLAMIHFGCTSADINSTSYAMMLGAIHGSFSKLVAKISSELAKKSRQWAGEPLLALTHGQPASPTTLGKELAVFLVRIRRLQFSAPIFLSAKMSGAVGGFHAHVAGFPGVDWPRVQKDFFAPLGITPAALTTQIDSHDCIAEYLYKVAMLNQVLLGLCRDSWLYISRGVFKLKKVDGEVGSSTMPHKVNPIDFENAEGNLQIGTDLCQVLARKLTVSRLQRDLSDSTALRSLGSTLGYSMIALQALHKGLQKLDFNQSAAAEELAEVPEVLTEGVQSALRANGVADAYEQLKEISRGAPLSLLQLRGFVEEHSDLTAEQKKYWSEMTPAEYVGKSEEITRDFLRTECS